MLQFFSPYTFLDIQSLVDAVNKLAEPSGWVIAQTIISGISIVLSLTLASIAWYRSFRKSWLKIKKVSSRRLLVQDKGVVVEEGLSLRVDIERDYKIPMEIYSAYVDLENKFVMGYKNIAEKDVFIGPVCFRLMRTTKFNMEDKMHDWLPTDEFVRHSLRDKEFHDIKKGDIVIYTNTGEYSHKLSKDEIKSFINTFDEAKEWVKI